MIESATRPLPSRANAIAMPAIVSAPLASGAIAGSSPPPKSPVWRSLPFIGGPAFPICADRARRIVSGSVRIARLRPRSRIIGATTSPRQPSSARCGAPPQANAGCVDCLLSKRAESLPLKRRLAVADLGAREKGLEAVVRRPGEDHPAQDLAPFVRRERGNENGAPKTPSHASTIRRPPRRICAEAPLREWSHRQATDRGCRVDDGARGQKAAGGRQSRHCRAASGRRQLHRLGNWNNREGIPLDHERSKLPRKLRSCGRGRAGGHQPDATATDGESAPRGLPDELLNLRRGTGACRPRDFFAAGEHRHGRDRADSVSDRRAPGARRC